MDKSSAANKMLKLPMFSHLDAKQVNEYLASIKYKILEFGSGQLIAERGERYENLLLLLDGTLSADIHDLQGRSLKVESLNAPDIVALGILFSDSNRLPIRLSAVTAATLLSVPKAEIVRLASKDPEIMRKLLNDSGNRIQFLAGKLRYMRFGTIQQKLCAWLLEQSSLQGSSEVQLPFTIEVLSELFGVERPSLSRVIGLLVNEGVIRRQKSGFLIVDRNRAVEYCDLE